MKCCSCDLQVTCLQDTVKDLSQRCKELKDRLDQASFSLCLTCPMMSLTFAS